MFGKRDMRILMVGLDAASSSYRVSGGSDHDFPSKSQKTNLLIFVPQEKKTRNLNIGKEFFGAGGLNSPSLHSTRINPSEQNYN